MSRFSLDPDKRTTLADAASRRADGDTIALGGGLCARLPMALVRELIRQGRTGLRVVGSAHSIDVDLLIAAGAVSVCEETYVGFEQDLGLAPAFRRGAESGAVEVRESSCVTMLTQLRAAEMGVPFLPVRGLKGTDLLTLHPEWGDGHLPVHRSRCSRPSRALTPDVALLHAPLGDAAGNLHLDQPYVLDERFAARVAGPSSPPSTGSCAPTRWPPPESPCRRTWSPPWSRCRSARIPSSCYPGYAYDRPHLAEYVAAATAGPDASTAYLERYVLPGEDAYRALVDPVRLTDVVGLGRGVEGAVPHEPAGRFDEWFVVTLARTIVDREVVFHGFASPCAQVAMHVARRTHAPDVAAHRGCDVRREPGAGVRPADGQRPGAAPRCGVPDALRRVLRRRLPRRRRPDVPLRRADRRARQHERDGDRRHAAPEDQARRRGRRREHLRDHRRAHAVDHAAPQRTHPRAAPSTSSPTWGT